MRVEMKPISVFRLGSKKVIQCRMILGEPQDALQRNFCYRDGDHSVSLLLTGLSTAWRDDNTFDFCFEGVLEPPITPSSNAVLESI